MRDFRHPIHRSIDRFSRLRSFEKAEWGDRAAVSFVIDDGIASDIEKGVEVLELFGVKGVFAPTSSLVGSPNYLTQPDLLRVANARHEIASHMDVHVPLWNRALPEIPFAMQTSRDEISRMTGGPIDCLVYPFGANTRAIRRQAAMVYRAGVCTWMGLNQGVFNRYAIRRVPFGSYAKPGEDRLQYYLDVVRKALKSKAWLVFMLHPDAAAHDSYQEQSFIRVIDFILESKMPVVTLTEALDCFLK